MEVELYNYIATDCFIRVFKMWHFNTSCTPIFVLSQNPKLRVKQKIRISQKSNSDDKGPVRVNQLQKYHNRYLRGGRNFTV